MNKGIIFCSTLHDPKGGLKGTFRKAMEVIKESGGVNWVINVTPSTDKGVKEELQELAGEGVIMIETQLDREHRLAENFIQDDHLRVVQKAVEVAKELGLKRIFYGDGDRINMASRNYPKEFRLLMELALREIDEEGTYVNFRRTREDYLLHQSPLYATERPFNELYSEAFEITLDIGSTFHGMSQDVAERIVKEGPKLDIEYPHPVFFIVPKEGGATIKSFEVNKVLTCETPEQSRPDIEAEFKRKFPSYKELQDAWRATTGLELLYSPKEWERRFKLEGQYIKVLKDHLGNFGLSNEKEQELLKHIDHTQEVMERRKVRILEALSKTPEGTLQSRKERGRKAMLEKSGLEKE